MPLNELTDFPDDRLDHPGQRHPVPRLRLRRRQATPVPRDWGFYDDPKGQLNDDTMPIVVRRGDETSELAETLLGRSSSASSRCSTASGCRCRCCARSSAAATFAGRPTGRASTWSGSTRPTIDGNDYRLVIALDTNLIEFVDEEAYLAPSPVDTRNGRAFSLPSPLDPIDWFLRESWVKDWCLDVFKEMIESEDRKRSGVRHARPLSLAELRDRMEGPHEHLARYRAFVELIHGLDMLPTFVLVDRSTEPRTAPIDVDLVIDLGNSRTCGLLIEAQPDQLGADITQAVKLQLRDLSRPELVYSDPFDSRLEFSRASFGRDHLSMRSGRAEAFAWPTDRARRPGGEPAREPAAGQRGRVRPVQPEALPVGRRSAARLLALQQPDGARRADRARHRRRLHHPGQRPRRRDPQDPARSPGARQAWFPSIRALYSRRNLTSFALAEIFVPGDLA